MQPLADTNHMKRIANNVSHSHSFVALTVFFPIYKHGASPMTLLGTLLLQEPRLKIKLAHHSNVLWCNRKLYQTCAFGYYCSLSLPYLCFSSNEHFLSSVAYQ